MKTLSLLIPGLLGPLPELNDSLLELPECRVLNTWLARGEKKHTQGDTYFTQLAELFGLQSDYSIAHASARFDQCDCAEAYWYRADPVHFKADMDHAVLFDCQQLNIQREEAVSMAEHFNAHFVDDGLQLVVANADRWYLRSVTELNINSTPVGEVIGRNVSHFLPTGEGALNWRRLLNEAQMLFHSHPVNELRENNGKLTINSLWLWGEGQSMSASTLDDCAAPGFSWLMANEAVASGLAMASACEHLPMAVNVSEVSNIAADGLIVIDDIMSAVNYGDVEAWHDAVIDVCHTWLQPLHKLLTSRKIQQLNLYTGEGRLFVLGANQLLKFWHRPAPLKKFMNTSR